MGPEDLVLIRWLQRSAWPTTHGSAVRKPGAEDVMKFQEARNLERAGMVKIVGTPLDIRSVAVVPMMDGEDEADVAETTGHTLSTIEDEDEAWRFLPVPRDGEDDLWDFRDS